MGKVLTCIVVLIALVSSATAAYAVPIPIANAGFESPPLSDGAAADNSIPSWSGTDTGASTNFGVFNPTVSNFPGQAPEGLNVAYIERGAIFQILAVTLAPGQYTLSA